MKSFVKRVVSILLILVLAFSMSSVAFATGFLPKKKVRVGHISHPGFIEHTESGEHVGYGVEYLDEICKYTNWEIEYVRDTWTNLMSQLANGEIDILPMAGHSNERAMKYDYSHQSIGIIQCLLLTESRKEEIYFEDFESFDGKTIGAQHNSMSIELLREYADKNGFTFQLAEYEYETELEEALKKGEIDIIAGEQMVKRKDLRVVAQFASEPYYIITGKGNPLMKEIDDALSRINAKDPTFRSKLYQKYYGDNLINAVPTFTRAEAEYIKKSGPITISLVPDSRPGAYQDENGKLVGIVPDILNEVARIAGLKFSYAFVPMGQKPLEYMQKTPGTILGGVLSINPAFEKSGAIVSDSFYTCYAALFKNSKQSNHIDISSGEYRIGTIHAFQAMQLYINNNYPNLKVVATYPTVTDGLNALNEGEIDLFTYDLNMTLHYFGNPRHKNVSLVSTSFLPEPESVVAMPTPENELLIGIINKCIAVIPQDTVVEIERYHLSKNAYQPTADDTLYRMRIPVICGLVAVTVIVVSFSLDLKRRQRNEKIIEEKNLELANALEREKHASNVKMDFLSRMSHDIRTPMNAIMGMTELAKADVPESSKAMGYLNKITISSQTLLNLLNDILDAKAIEDGKLRIAHVSFNIYDELQKIIDIYSAQCEFKGIEFKYDYSKIQDNWLVGDPLRLSQVLLNLLSNACKFTDEGGTITVVGEEIKQTDTTISLRCTISDTGCGMTDDMMSRIFKPFEQQDATTAHKYGGSGLGLNIVKSIIALKNGTIDVESAEGVGTTFVVEVPFEIDKSRGGLERSPQEEIAPKLEEPAEPVTTMVDTSSQFDFSGKKILVVDDDSFNCDVVIGFLDRVGAESECVHNGQAAVDLFCASEPSTYDAILMDVHMPVKGGYEATEMIRHSDHPDAEFIPIFALTADAFPEDIDKACHAGMNGHLKKPLYPDALYKTLSTAFDSAENE